MVLIRYPLKPGKHLPSSSREDLCVLRHLDRVHKLGYVHGDIIASNLLFGTEGCVLDFDLCGRVGTDEFNVNIADGRRHPRISLMLAQTSIGSQRRRATELGDDWFSLAAVLRFVQPVVVAQRPLWGSGVMRWKLAAWKRWQQRSTTPGSVT